MSYDWIFSKINNLIESPPNDYNFDPDYLHLVNPTSEKIIDDMFFKIFLPKIEKSFNNSPFEIFKDDNYPYFNNKICAKLSKDFVLVIDDPKRPFEYGIGNKMWYSRFELVLSKYDYMFTTDLILYLPENYDIKKIIRLMKDPYFVGLPPNLSIDDKSYSLKFCTGKGAGWGLETYDSAANNISDKIIQIQTILKFLNINESELNTEVNFTKLEKLLERYFDNR
jgi:hypothetical protein